jgi:hypothetical protein
MPSTPRPTVALCCSGYKPGCIGRFGGLGASAESAATGVIVTARDGPVFALAFLLCFDYQKETL